MSHRPLRHGTRSCYVNHHCDCVRCRTANAADGQRRILDRIARGIPDHVHGTLNGYNNYLCRCEPCRAVKSDYNRATRLAHLRAHRTQESPHGL